jgi:hypothetical protein
MLLAYERPLCARSGRSSSASTIPPNDQPQPETQHNSLLDEDELDKKVVTCLVEYLSVWVPKASLIGLGQVAPRST